MPYKAIKGTHPSLLARHFTCCNFTPTCPREVTEMVQELTVSTRIQLPNNHFGAVLSGSSLNCASSRSSEFRQDSKSGHSPQWCPFRLAARYNSVTQDRQTAHHQLLKVVLLFPILPALARKLGNCINEPLC